MRCAVCFSVLLSLMLPFCQARRASLTALKEREMFELTLADSDETEASIGHFLAKFGAAVLGSETADGHISFRGWDLALPLTCGTHTYGMPATGLSAGAQGTTIVLHRKDDDAEVVAKLAATDSNDNECKFLKKAHERINSTLAGIVQCVDSCALGEHQGRPASAIIITPFIKDAYQSEGALDQPMFGGHKEEVELVVASTREGMSELQTKHCMNTLGCLLLAIHDANGVNLYRRPPSDYKEQGPITIKIQKLSNITLSGAELDRAVHMTLDTALAMLAADLVHTDLVQNILYSRDGAATFIDFSGAIDLRTLSGHELLHKPTTMKSFLVQAFWKIPASWWSRPEAETPSRAEDETQKAIQRARANAVLPDAVLEAVNDAVHYFVSKY